MSLLEQSERFLRQAIELVENTTLRELCKIVVNDPKFLHCTASRSGHQSYRGGLVVHTAEVLDTALNMAKSPHLVINRDILITSTIYHDYGKIYDYSATVVAGQANGMFDLVEKYEYTEHQKLIKHLPRSYAMFMVNVSDKKDLSDELITAIGHCILSHHGRKDWGSPIEPLTTEAHLLHYADMVSAHCSLKDYTRD